MKNISLAETIDTPEISFDNKTKVLQIIGNSYPENCEKIYEPIKTFLDSYNIEKHKELHFHFYYNLLNSTSTVYLAQIIVQIATLAKNGLITSIKWSYDDDDEELLELGEKMATISNLKFEYIAIKEE